MHLIVTSSLLGYLSWDTYRESYTTTIRVEVVLVVAMAIVVVGLVVVYV